MIERGNDLVTVTMSTGKYCWPVADFDSNTAGCLASLGGDLAETRELIIEALADVRWRKCQRFTYDGVVTAADAAMPALTGAVVAMQMLDPQGTLTWKLATGEFRTWGLSDLVAFGAAIRAHIQGCFNKEATLSADIAGAASLEALSAIDIMSGW